MGRTYEPKIKMYTDVTIEEVARGSKIVLIQGSTVTIKLL